MAEFIVNFVLTKLADAVVQEAISLYGVDEKVDAVSRELGRIQVFLKGADKKHITDEQQKYWVKEVRDVAYSMEDVIDTFLMEIPQQPQKSTGVMEKMKKKFKIAKKIPAVHKLLNEISLIQTKMEEIEKSRLRYGINNLGEGGGEIQLPIRPLILPDIDPEIIGFNKARNHIVKELLNETTKKRYVVSIWGPGGLGKTTLAQKIYNSNDVKEQFGVRIWVVISQKFQLIDILRKIMKQLNHNYKQSEDEDEAALLTKIHESLRGKTYLIVFDDVWTNDLWIQIEASLPNDNNGSRILMTTRNSDVSKEADPTCEPYKLEYLTNELSFELLLKKAIPNHDPNNSAFHGLSEILNQFVHKCDGLPLALVVVGGLLSKKPCNYNAWSKVLKTMSWHADGKKCSEIIGTSYDDLPFALKSCFMYFAAFPEDYEFTPRELIQMWIAEGFIQQEDNRTLEETAESFLEDLVQRSMVSVKSRSHDGSIGRCYIHDLLRDLAIQKAKDDKFLVVYSHPNDQRFMSGARRVAIHHLDCDELMLSQNLRTLFYFGNKYMPNCSKQRLLKVVCTGSSLKTKIKLEMFEGLTQLRYLDLTGQPNDKWEGCLEKVIGAMKFLQTLWFYITDKDGWIPIPDSLWHINTLRHVNAYKSREMPPSTKLTNLQTLSEMIVTESWETESPHLPNLRGLRLGNNKSVSAGSVVTFLGTLEHLITLEIEVDHIPLHIFDMRCFPFYQNLQSLRIYNTCETPHEIAIDVSMFPPHLTYLSISNYQFHQDVMSVLEKLPCLKVLCLDEVFTNKKLSCSAKGFNQLESLDLSDMTFEDWEIEDGAMPILRELVIYRCRKLCVPQGLRHLTHLQKLGWLSSDCGGKTDGEIMNLLKDVVPSNVQIDLR
ncbi:disease resistance protein RPP13-like [Carex rostrata]